MTILFVILGVLGAAVAVVLGLAARRPDESRIERARSIPATPAAIQAQLVDFHRWRAWSPWERLDPNLNRAYSGAASGVGAGYAWQGNNKAGEGRMTIVAVEPTRVEVKLEFIKPFAATNTTIFALAPDGAATTVTWTMLGRSSFGMKIFGVLFNLDKLVGRDFERGLAQLAEACAAPPA
jgi:hypothetical protein